MTARWSLGLVSLIVLIVAVGVHNSNYGDVGQCRSIPGDPSWPSEDDWDGLNQTVQGRLIANTPLAAACHHSSLDGTDTYDQEKCDALRDAWFFPETHLVSPSSPMAYQFTNNSCNPFLDPDYPCSLGYHAEYTINATSASDLQAAVRFVKRHNIRLVIRNTGHDYLGKSTGAYALAVWTRHMKSMEHIPKYELPQSEYQGPAFKVGAGIENIEAYKFANSHGLMVVGGNCPNVGLAGGYTQGGGISILSSKYGLAADQVLSWEVVTASGDLVTASPAENTDLFWALRGGGGGTYGIVVSMTVKAHPDTFFSAAYMNVFNDGNNTDAIYSSLGTFFQSLPSLVDAGAWVVWVAAPFGFMIIPAMVAGLHAEELDAYLQPTREKMDQLGLQYQYSSAEYPGFIESYNSIPSMWNVSDFTLGGRLMPRELVQDQDSTDALVNAVRTISSQALMSGVSFNVANAVSSPSDIAANPYFRKTLFSAVVGAPINYTDWTATKAAQDQITYKLLPELKALTPNGAGYLSEADFQEPDFKTTFYGAHYEKLLDIKQKYDPDDIFYAKTAVGSDRWDERVDGRLCTKPSIWDFDVLNLIRRYV
ncbi:FAD-binding domain-containing protein [Daldinia loculata]|uniref:FAD-binding domain-containing protein n=1 Tax=Daldinia loculata TaxID=103429 RepID=UPI0020C2B9C3|nr:FAD-binding domain-containing protein [Daldinia loculata]KAI1647062.1 FAD-binding domain-containing protein [Daldinia loculata]